MKSVLCVPRTKLFEKHHFEGFCSVEAHNYLPLIQTDSRPLPRTDELENNPQEKQMITYAWIINPHKKTVLIYQRTNNKQDYPEQRLFSKWSAGIGGHIEPEGENSVTAAFDRELHEELTMKQYPTPTIIGFVNHDENVEAMHFGIVGVALTTEDVKKGDNEMVGCKFVTKNEFESMSQSKEHQFEMWTQLTWPHIRDTYLS